MCLTQQISIDKVGTVVKVFSAIYSTKQEKR